MEPEVDVVGSGCDTQQLHSDNELKSTSQAKENEFPSPESRQCHTLFNASEVEQQTSTSGEDVHLQTSTTLETRLTTPDCGPFSNQPSEQTTQLSPQKSCATSCADQHGNQQSNAELPLPAVSARSTVTLGDTVVAVKHSPTEPDPAAAYSLAESQLVILERDDIDSLVQSGIVQEIKAGDSEAREITDVKQTHTFNSRWPHHETVQLIQLYKENCHFFTNKHFKKKTVWAMIATKLAKGSKLRMQFTSEQVYNRWKNLTKIYRDCVSDMEQGRLSASKFRYFDEMSSVYGTKHLKKPAFPEHSVAPSVSAVAKQTSSTLPSNIPQPLQNYVAIAPKLSKSHGNEMPSQTDSAVLSDKAVCGRTHCEEGDCFMDVVQAVERLREDHRKSEEWKLNKLEQMHKEKMQMFSKLLDVILTESKK